MLELQPGKSNTRVVLFNRWLAVAHLADQYAIIMEES